MIGIEREREGGGSQYGKGEIESEKGKVVRVVIFFFTSFS